jgi:hypothetical protein
MGVLSALIAYLEAPETVHPRQSSFHNPPVCAQFLAGLDAPPCYPRRYAPLPQSLAASREVVIFVGVQLHGAFARSPPRRLADGRDGVDRLLQNAGVVDVGRRVDHRERDAFSVDHNVALRARFALIRRIRAGLLAPRGAATLAESTQALSQSIWSASPNRSRSFRCSLSHTPASCHSLRRRQQVIPEPQPISWGNISQGMPLFRTKMMPVRAARSSMRGLPPLGLTGSSGNSGSIASQSSSVTSSLAMPSPYPLPGFVRRTKSHSSSNAQFVAVSLYREALRTPSLSPYLDHDT